MGSDIHGSLGRAEIFEEPRNGYHTDIVLALPERGSFLGENSDDRYRMAVNLNYFPDRRLVRKKIFLNGLADHDNVPSKIDVFVGQVAAVGERIGIRRQKTFV